MGLENFYTNNPKRCQSLFVYTNLGTSKDIWKKTKEFIHNILTYTHNLGKGYDDPRGSDHPYNIQQETPDVWDLVSMILGVLVIETVHTFALLCVNISAFVSTYLTIILRIWIKIQIEKQWIIDKSTMYLYSCKLSLQ